MTDRGGQSPDARRPARPDPADAVQCALSVLLESVAPAERTAYILHELMGLSLTQTAAVLHRSPAATKRMAERARLQLRELAPSARTPP